MVITPTSLTEIAVLQRSTVHNLRTGALVGNKAKRKLVEVDASCTLPG